MPTVPTTYYTTVRKVAEFLNLVRRVQADNPAAAGAEAVGTGDGTTTTFYLDNYNVVSGSEQVYVAGTLKTVTTHYTIDADAGTITFTAGNVPTAGQAITANYWHSDIPSSVIGNYINRAEYEINTRVGRSFYTSATVTSEVYDGDAVTEVPPWAYGGTFKTAFVSNSPSDNTYYQNRILPLKYYPVLTVTSVVLNGTTLASTDYVLYSNPGYIGLTDTGGYAWTQGQQNIAVTYTYGYSAVPILVEELATKMASIYAIESRLLGDPAQNLNIKEQNISIIRADITRMFQSLGEMLEVRRL